MDICGHCECGPDQIKQEDVGCFCETKRAPVQRRTLGDQEKGPLSQMRDQEEQGPPPFLKTIQEERTKERMELQEMENELQSRMNKMKTTMEEDVRRKKEGKKRKTHWI